MSCEIYKARGGVSLIVTYGGPWFSVGGYKFEMHHYCGPSLLKESGELREGMIGPRHGFWKAFKKWQKFNQELRDQTQIELRGRKWYYSQSGLPLAAARQSIKG